MSHTDVARHSTSVDTWSGSAGRTALLGFLAAVLSVLVFHQGTVWLLYTLGYVSNGPYAMRPIPPLGVPQIVSQLFWGGLWGIVIALVLRATRWPALLTGFLIGVFGVALVAVAVVPAIKGLPTFAGGDPLGVLRVCLIGGAFGWGTALILTRVLRRL